MDVTTFMATICPIAAVAVLPLAVAHGGVFGMSGTGWTYTLILTLTSGVVAQGLVVFAQKSIQIGTIGIAQVAQPALAVVWSFLLLDEVVNHRQIAGIAVVVGGLLAFVLLNQRGARKRRIDEEREKVIASQGSGVAM
jgi:drug/metabolite transporter (DMT)-like permease